MDKYYTIPEAATMLRVTRAAIYKWMQSGQLESVKVGSVKRITQAGIDKFVQDSSRDDAQPQKRIEPIRNAKGRTIGHRAYYGDHIVGDFDLMDKDGAQLALDRFVYKELSK